MSDAKTPESIMQFDVISRKGKKKFHLTATHASNGLKFDCSCNTELRSRLPRPGLRLASGDRAAPVEPCEHLIDLLQIIASTPLPKAIQELGNLEKERDSIEYEIDMQKRFILELMSGLRLRNPLILKMAGIRGGSATLTGRGYPRRASSARGARPVPGAQA